MKTYVLLPLGLSALCLLWVWLANRRPRLTGVLWPDGLSLSGEVARPELVYDGDVVLGCAGSFGSIRCRSLTVARGADVSALEIEAARVRVDGRLRGVRSLSAGRRLTVNGELKADEVTAPRILLGARSRAVVLTIRGACRLDRHPKAVMKGFFTEEDELPAGDTRVSGRGAGQAPVDETAAITALRRTKVGALRQ